MAELDAYLPMEVRWALVQDQPLAEHAQGAVLFADVSGSTRLTAALARELGARRGAEELTRQLDYLFTALITQVHNYGGSVTGFSGDAITCWFDQSHHPNSNAAGRAIAAALAMQAAMRSFAAITTPAGATFALGIKVAIVAGMVRRFVIGDPAIQRLESLTGATMNRLGLAEQQARLGEVVVGAEIVAQFASQLTLKEWRPLPNGERFAVITHLAAVVTPSPWPVLPPLPPTMAQPWLLPPVFQRLQAGHSGFLAELRPVVAFFLKFSGIDYDGDAAAGSKLHGYIAWVQTVLARFEGYLLHVTMGDKGSYFNAAFGALQAHEDDPVRAIAAALALQAMPPELHFIADVQIGIGQDLSFVGAYGSAERRTYGILGNEVNIAARLMSAAQPGEILVTPRIAALVQEHFSVEPGQPVAIKGVTEPLVPAVVRARQSSAFANRLQPDPTHIVGRAEEQRLLTARLQALNQGAAGCVIIEGEAGIGKSRLIEALLNQAQTQHVPYLVGAGQAIENATPYYAWRPIFRSLLGIEHFAHAAEAQQQLLTNWAGHPERLIRLPLLNVVTGLYFPDNQFTSQLTGNVRADNTRQLLVEILNEDVRSGSGLLLVLDDAHWLDSASWALARAVSEQAAAILLVVTLRPLASPVPDEYAYLRALPTTQLLSLTALPPAEITTLICQRLGVTALPPAVEELLRSKAEGHPFFSEELIYALRDAGLLRVVAGQCELTVAADVWQNLEFPDTIQAVITSRIDRLPPNQQLLLKVASVIGRVFAVRTLYEVHPIPTAQDELLHHLHSTAQMDLTTLATAEPELAYLFRHIITQEVTYQLLLYTQRQDLHRAVATWYERTYQDLAPYYPTLAHHWEQVGELEQALAYLDKAGQQAYNLSANREALYFFSRAVQLEAQLSNTPAAVWAAPHSAQTRTAQQQRRAHLQYYVGRVKLDLGLLSESQQHFEAALRLFGYPLPTTNWQWVGTFLRAAIRQYWHRQGFSPPNRLGKPLDDAQLAIAHIYSALGALAAVKAGKATVCLLLLALNSAEQAPPSPELALASADMANVAGFLRLRRWAEDYLQQAVNTVHQLNRPLTLALAFSRFSIYLISRGDWQRSETFLVEAVRNAEQIGHRHLHGECLAMLLAVYWLRGRYAQGVEVSATQLHLAQHSGAVIHQVWALNTQAFCHLRLHQLAEAIQLAEQLLRLLEEKKLAYPEVKLNALGILAVAHARAGQVTSAQAPLESALAIVQKQSLPGIGGISQGITTVTEGCLILLENQSVQGGELLRLAQKFCEALTPFPSAPIQKIAADLYRGKLAVLTGKSRQARHKWRKALAAAEQLELPFHEACLHFELGHPLLATTAAHKLEQERHLRRAIALFTQLGAPYELAHAQRALQENRTLL